MRGRVAMDGVWLRDRGGPMAERDAAREPEGPRPGGQQIRRLAVGLLRSPIDSGDVATMLCGRLVAVGGALLLSVGGLSDLAAQVVPASAPDTVPSTLWDQAKWVEVSGGQLLSTSILTTQFKPGATQPERQAAVHAIQGTVIGGTAFAGDGVYYIRVRGDSTVATIDSIRRVLVAMPQVQSSGPMSAGGVTTN